MSTPNYMIIRNAILNKQQVVAIYKEHVREMCPHTIGLKNGREKALFYQFGGTSSSGQIIPGSPKNWRCVFVEELTNIVVRSGSWSSAENHSVKQTCIDEVDIEVSAK